MEKDYIKYFKIIGQINDIVNMSKSIEEVLSNVLKIISETLNVKYATFWFKDDNNSLHPYYSLCPNDLSELVFNSGEGVVGKVFETGKSISIIDFENNKEESVLNTYNGLNIKSYICTPIENRSGIIGAFEVINEENIFNEEEQNILEMLTTIATIKIEDSDKYQQVWEEKEKLISIKDVTKSFKNGETVTKVLKGINLDVYKGEFVVLLGESGCGKSTLLNIVGGMDNADSGTIMFSGKDMSHPTEKELTNFRRHNLGFIFQSYNLMPNLNVKENLDLIADLVKEPMDTMEALELVGLKEKANNYPSQLSGGQQQRVSIARALVKKPILILADEPTAALDYETSIEVLSVLEEVYKQGSTLLMVTHNEEIAKMANRVVKFRNGKVHEIKINRYPAKAQDLVW